MTIRTERLLLRPVMATDWRDLQALWIDFSASACAQYDKPHPTDEETVRARVARWEAVGSPEHRFYAACLNGRVIGYIACHDRGEGVFECGYCFHSAFHGQGYASESFRAVIARLTGDGAQQRALCEAAESDGI